MDLTIDYAETRRAAHRLDRHSLDLQDRASPRAPDLGPPADVPVEGALDDLGRSTRDLSLRLSRLATALAVVEQRAGEIDEAYAAHLLTLEVP